MDTCDDDKSFIFNGEEYGKEAAIRQDRRSGAQKGRTRERLRPEVFLGAPIAYSARGFSSKIFDSDEPTFLSAHSYRPEVFLVSHPSFSEAYYD